MGNAYVAVAKRELGSVGALVAANARFWPTVAPRVSRRLGQWERRAQAIPDPGLRALALAKLRDEGFNAEVAATLTTLVPWRSRGPVVDAVVALQVMYDLLDGLSEASETDSLQDGMALYRAFDDALSPSRPARGGYYERRGSALDDGGYLAELVTAVRSSVQWMPAFEAVGPVARAAACRCAEAQIRTHAIPTDGVDQLAAWARPAADRLGWTWWEYAAGGAASILAVHALLATAAAHVDVSGEQAAAVDAAYLHICALSTLLDSLVDRRRDREHGAHSFIGYYETDATAVAGLRAIARAASAPPPGTGHTAHHAMTAAGVAGYYLSAPEARAGSAAAVADAVRAELPPVIHAVLGVFAAWRAAKRMRRR